MTNGSAPHLDAEPLPSLDELHSRGTAIVLRKLNANQRTRFELARCLSEKDIPRDVAESILDRVTELGYINDSEFAIEWVRTRIRTRGSAPSVLRRELMAKGVGPDLIDEALADIDPLDMRDRAQQLAEKKYRNMSGLPGTVALRRIASLLQRKGYSASESWTIAREVVGGDVEELETEVIDSPRDYQ